MNEPENITKYLECVKLAKEVGLTVSCTKNLINVKRAKPKHTWSFYFVKDAAIFIEGYRAGLKKA